MRTSIQLAGVLLCAMFLFPFSMNAQCDQLEDYDALMAIFDQNGGANLDINPNKPWGGTDCTDLDEWQGVFTNADGRVTRLNLPNAGLIGEIAPEIADLTMLERLNLRGNDGLEGELPIVFTEMPSLERLNLRGCGYKGCIPEEYNVFCSGNQNFIRLDGIDCLADYDGGGSLFKRFCNGAECEASLDPACATCNDGAQNGTETGVDCGGDCDACPVNIIAQSVEIQNGLTALSQGQEFIVSVEYEVEYENFTEAARVAFYFSEDDVFDGSDIFLEDLAMNGTVGQYSFNFNNIQTVPLSAPADEMGYIIMFVDNTELVSEGVEDDNFAVYPFMVVGATCDDGILNGDEIATDCGGNTCVPCDVPDVVANAVTIQGQVDEVEVGGTFTVTVNYSVEDFSFPENSEVGFYLSTDNVWDPNVDVFLEDIGLNNAVGDYAFNFGNIMTVPLDFPVGDAFLLMVVDDLEIVEESDETNNVAEWPVFILPESAPVIEVPSSKTVSIISIGIHPNPSTEGFNITGGNPESDYNISLFSHEGKLVKRMTGSSLPQMIDVSQLADGMYFLKLETQGETVTKKIMIAR